MISSSIAASGPGRKIKRVSDVNAMGPSAPMAGASPFMQPAGGTAILDPMMGGGSDNLGGGFAGGMGQPQTSMGAPFNNGGIPMQSQQNYGYASPSPQPQYSTAPSGGPQQFGGMGAPPQGGGAQQFSQPQAGFAGGQYPPQQAAGFGAGAGQFGQQPGAAGQFPQFAMFQQPIVHDMAMQYGQRLADQGKQMMESQFSKYVPVAKLKYYFAVDNNYVINKLRLLFFPFTHKVS